MKAAVVQHRAAPVSIVEMPQPQPRSNELLVRIVAASVNPIDWKIRERGDRATPFVLGQDFAGVVSDVGRDVRSYRIGERIFGIARDHGAYAQYTVVPEDDRPQPVAKIPDDVGDADAASLPTAGLTALAGIEILGVTKDTTLLIAGATGGVGGFAAQIAHDRGAHVIGTAHSRNEAFARSLGVDEFVAYDRGDVTAAVKAAHPNGVDAVLDLVSDATKSQANAAILHAGGKIASTIGALDTKWFQEHGFEATNIALVDTPQSSHAGLRTLARMLEEGRLRVVIAEEMGLGDAERALQESAKGTVNGKIVLTIA